MYCGASKEEKERGCPNCEFTLQWNEFKHDCENLLAEDEVDRQRYYELKGQKCSKWQFEELYSDLAAIGATEARVGEDMVAPYWNIRTARLVSILRSERYKKRRIDDYDREQKAEAARREAKG